MSGTEAEKDPSRVDQQRGNSPVIRYVPLALALVASAITWLIVLTRAVPSRTGDRGVFVSVAERLVAGDRLYTEVWENKDPFFFYLLASGRTVSPYSDYVIEILWLVAAAIAGYSMARYFRCDQKVALLAGGSGVPLILVGGEYIAGFTHLPGSALTVIVVALAFRQRYGLVGVLLVALALLKLIALPVAIAALIPVVWMHRRRSTFVALATSTVGAAVLAALLLAWRGELGGYLAQLSANFTYASGHYRTPGSNPYLTHVEYTITASATVTIAAIVVITAFTYQARGVSNSDTAQRTLWFAVVFSLVMALGVIAATGLRYHHAQILYAPAALALLLLAARARGLRLAPLPSTVGLPFAAIVLAGGFAPQSIVIGAQGSLTQLRDLAKSPAATQVLLEYSDASSYARLGDNMDEGLARGLGDWTLACPRFSQYGTDTAQTLQELTNCLPSAEFLVVHSSFAPVENWPQGYLGIDSFDVWNDWVQRTEEVLQQRFTCSDYPWGRLCEQT